MRSCDRLAALAAGMAFLAATAGCARDTPTHPPLPEAPARRQTFVELVRLGDRSEWRFAPLLLDVDGDGHVDIVTTARLLRPSLHVWLGDGRGGFRALAPGWTDVGYGPVASADVDGDGLPDLVTGSHFSPVQSLLNRGGGRFEERTFGGREGSGGLALADFDRDGRVDLALLGFLAAGIDVYLGNGAGVWTPHARLPRSRPGRHMPGRALAAGDLDGDGHPDLVAAFQRWGVYVAYGDGRGGFSGQFEIPDSRGRDVRSLALADVNRDGLLDIAFNATGVAPGGGNGPDVFLNDGRRGWRAASAGLKIFPVSAAGVAIADVDRDGHLDLVAGGAVTLERADGFGLFWFRGDGQGGWRLVEGSGLPRTGLPMPEGLAIGDLDGDGWPEVVATLGSIPVAGRGAVVVWTRR